MQNTTAHQDQCPTCSQAVTAAPGQLPPAYMPRMTSYSVEYTFGQLGSAVLAMLPPSFLCTASLGEHGKLKSPWLQ